MRHDSERSERRDITEALNLAATWQRAFRAEEVAVFVESDGAANAVERRLSADNRFVPLGPTEEQQELFIAKRALIRWLLALNQRLALAAVARLTARQVANLMTVLRSTGRWTAPPAGAVKFGKSHGLLCNAWQRDAYVFPIAAVLAPVAPVRQEISSYLARRFGLEYDPETEIVESAMRRVLADKVCSRGGRTNQDRPLKDAVAAITRPLPARVRDILLARTGCDGSRRSTLSELGTRVGLTRERVRQIESRQWAEFRQCPAIIERVLVALIGFIVARRGSIRIAADGEDVAPVIFSARCLGILHDSIPQCGSIVLGHRAAGLALPGPGTFLSLGFKTSAIAEWIDSHWPNSLPAEDVRALAEGAARFYIERADKTQRVYLALRAIGRPAHYSEVAAVHNSMFPKHPASGRNVHAALGREAYGIVWIGVRSTFALREWGYERPSRTLFEAASQIVQSIMKKTGRPVPFSVVAAEVMKERPIVNSSSLVIATHCNPELRRVGRDSFVPRTPEEAREELGPEELDRVLREFEGAQGFPGARSKDGARE